ncbi:MAG: EcsC family protein [Leptospiraceae bacterium]|nr:EcsC family protein [Leptospiraceae bacterium]
MEELGPSPGEEQKSEFEIEVGKEFDEWKNEPPNMIQRGVGIISKPLSLMLHPIVKSVIPHLEEVIKKLNSTIADVMKNYKDDSIDIYSLTEEEFQKWVEEKDGEADTWAKFGIATLSGEGGVGGFLGVATVLAEIPISFATLLSYANKIAIVYKLDIQNEDVQMELLKAIAAGSATNIETKLETVALFNSSLKIIQSTTWKVMEKMPIESLGGTIYAIRSLLRNIGSNITRRKASQLIPGLGAIAGATINGAWGSDCFKAVKEYSRFMVVKSYYSNKNPQKEISEK